MAFPDPGVAWVDFVTSCGSGGRPYWGVKSDLSALLGARGRANEAGAPAARAFDLLLVQDIEYVHAVVLAGGEFRCCGSATQARPKPAVQSLSRPACGRSRMARRSTANPRLPSVETRLSGD